jgi:hypothetical protein
METQTAADGEVLLEVCDETLPVPKNADDIARAVDSKPHDEEFTLTLTLANDDLMDVWIDEKGEPFTVLCLEGEKTLEAVSTVHADLLKRILASFLAGDGDWRTMCSWREKQASKEPKFLQHKYAPWLTVIPVGFIFLGTIGKGTWAIAFLLCMVPVVFAAIIVLKLQEAKRAAKWATASGRIVRSELKTEKRNNLDVVSARVDYEFDVRFDKFRGNRVSLAEITSEPEARAIVGRYRVGASTPVYYDPADPRKSVLERKLPEKFGLIWIIVAVVAVACFGGAAMIVMS